MDTVYTTTQWSNTNAMSTDDTPRYSAKPFGEALIDLLARHQGHAWKISIQAFAAETGMNYGTLRSAVIGRTMPAVETLERVARALHIAPEYFREYRAHQIIAAVNKAIEHSPEIAGMFYETVMAETAALDELAGAHKSSAPPQARENPQS